MFSLRKGNIMCTICICGGGSLGHVIAGWLSARNHAQVNILTNRPEKWNHEIKVYTPEGVALEGTISKISNMPEDVVAMADVILLCLPGFLIKKELEKIKQFLPPHAFVGSVFSSTGFFFEAQKLLNGNQPLWGFQRVPFISRVEEYGKSAHLLGYKSAHNIAVESVTDEEKANFALLMQEWFERPVNLLKNYYEASLTTVIHSFILPDFIPCLEARMKARFIRVCNCSMKNGQKKPQNFTLRWMRSSFVC